MVLSSEQAQEELFKGRKRREKPRQDGPLKSVLEILRKRLLRGSPGGGVPQFRVCRKGVTATPHPLKGPCCTRLGPPCSTYLGTWEGVGGVALPPARGVAGSLDLQALVGPIRSWARSELSFEIRGYPITPEREIRQSSDRRRLCTHAI